MNRTSRIERTDVLRWVDVVTYGGVTRGMNILGGGGTGAGGDVNGGGTTLGGSIAAVTGGGGRMVVG